MISRAMTGDPSGPAGPVGPGIVLGRVAGPFGVKGWVKVKSYTEPTEGILGYRDWHVDVPGANQNGTPAEASFSPCSPNG